MTIEHSHEQPAGNILLGFLHLARDVGDLVPAVVSPESTLHGGGHRRDQREARGVNHGTAGGEIGNAAARGQEERAEKKQRHGDDFGDREYVLHNAAKSDADVIHGREAEHQRGGQPLDTNFCKRCDVTDEAKMDGKSCDRTAELGKFYKLRGVFRKDIRDGGDGTGLDHREHGPAIKIGEEGAKHAVEIDILAAGFGDHAGNLRVGKRAEKGDRARNEPNPQQQFGRADLRGHDPGFLKMPEPMTPPTTINMVVKRPSVGMSPALAARRSA